MIPYLLILLLIFVNIYLYNSNYILDDNLAYNLLYLYLIIIVHSINKVYSVFVALSYIILKTNRYKSKSLESFEDELDYTEYNDEDNYETTSSPTENETETYDDNDNYDTTIETKNQTQEQAEEEKEEEKEEPKSTVNIKENNSEEETEYEESEYEESGNEEPDREDNEVNQNDFKNKIMNSCNRNNMSSCLVKHSLQVCLNKYCNSDNEVNTTEDEENNGNF